MRICWSWTLFVLMVAILALMTVLGGCGQKGPLYLPDDPAAEQTDDD
ncbi:MAG: LPS translocon maturation chaperone LptM [Pseudomonadota bacterium]